MGGKKRNIPAAHRREDFVLVCFISAAASIVASKAEDFAPTASPMMSLLHGVVQPHRDGEFSADAIAGAIAQAPNSGRKILLSNFSSLLAVKSVSHLKQE